MVDFQYQGIPTEAIPAEGSPARRALNLYMNGGEIEEQALYNELGLNCRSLLQRLRGDRFLHWNLISIKEDGEIIRRYLDPRHLSGDRYQDALARAERKKELKEDSHKEAMLGASRIGSAYEDLIEATQKLSELKKPIKEVTQ
jgi:hypothetical protein